jgi:hypothetical protein
MLRFYQVFMGALFLVSVIIIARGTTPEEVSLFPSKAPQALPLRLTNQEFYASTLQRALIRKLNGTLALEGAGPVYVESPASPEETLQLCHELHFGLPWLVLCEPTRIGFEASPFAGGRLVLNNWYREREGKRQEFLEMGLLLTECADDLCVPLSRRDVQFAPSVEGKDHRGRVAQ